MRWNWVPCIGDQYSLTDGAPAPVAELLAAEAEQRANAAAVADYDEWMAGERRWLRDKMVFNMTGHVPRR